MTKRILASVLAAASLLTLTACADRPTRLRLGAGGTGGTYYSYATAMGGLLADALGDSTPEVVTTAGSAANLRLLNEEYVDLAISQSDLMDEAYYATGIFDGETPRTDFSAVAGLYTEPCQIVVRAGEGIETVADLLGAAAGGGGEESGVVENARQILSAYGLSFDMIQKKQLSFSDAAAALAAGEIDAFFCTAGTPTNAVTNLARETDVALLRVDGAAAARLTETYGAYIPCTIPAGTYAGQTEAVETLGVQAVLLASNKVDAALIETLTEALFENADALQSATAADTPLSQTSATEGVTIPFHAGAAQYYGELGISVETEG